MTPRDLYADVADRVFGEIQALLFGQRRLQVLGAADQAGLALLADAALEDRLDEDRAAAVDQVLDLVIAGFRSEHSRRSENQQCLSNGAPCSIPLIFIVHPFLLSAHARSVKYSSGSFFSSAQE